MLSRRTLVVGLAGAAISTLLSSREARAQLIGTHEVPDELLPLYLANQSWVGLPQSEAYPVTGGLKQVFVHADMYYASSVGPSIVTGHIKTAYDGAHGPDALGLPIATEVVSRTYSARTQWFTDGRIWWCAAEHAKVVRASKTVRLKGARNFRDVAGEGSGIAVDGGHMKRGVVYRSNALGGTSKMDRFILQTLGVGTMVALSPATPPSISGIARVRYSLSNPKSAPTLAAKKAMYRQYVTKSSNRKSVGKVLQRIADSDQAVVFQCLKGWDRSGWVAAVIEGLLGASPGTIMHEFLKSNDYYGHGVKSAYLQAGVDRLATSYGSYEGYVTACGVSADTIAALRRKLVV